MFKKDLLFGLAILFSLAVSGQKGAISGIVLDEDGFPMLGANVVIQGTTNGAQTDFIEGKYQFQTEPGIYSIVASYVGYEDQILEGVEVVANETTILDISFAETAGVDLGVDVTVTAKAIERSEVAVLKLRQNSDKVQDVISSQEIQRLGAGTAAAALTKVTGTSVVDGKYVYVRGLGDRYSATTVNGLRLPSIDPYRNSAQLDLIPTNLLDNIVANKTFSPDLPGDFTGGSVNIKLKDLPERFKWGISVSSSYNTQASLQDEFITFDAGDRAGIGFNDGTLDRPAAVDGLSRSELQAVAGRFSYLSARNDDDVAAQMDAIAKGFGNDFDQSFKSAPLDYSIGANIGNQFNLGGMPVGVFASANFSKDYSFYDNGVNANWFRDVGQDESLVPFYDLTDRRSVETPKLGAMAGLSLRPNSANSITFYTIYSHQAFLEGRDLIGSYQENIAIDFDPPGSFYRAQTSSFTERALLSYVLSGEHTLTGLGNTKVEWDLNYVDSEQNEPDTRFLGYILDQNIGRIPESQLVPPSYYYRDLSDDQYQGKVDITVPFLQKKSRGNSIKFGGLYSTKERDFNESIFAFIRNDASISRSFRGSDADINSYLADDNIGLIGEGAGGRNEIGAYIIDNTNPSNSYIGESNVGAGYLMATYELSERFKVIGGARVETTDISVSSDFLLLDPDALLQSGSIDTVNFLPALNMVYKVGENTNLRASFSQTIARPNLREIAPFGAFGFVGEPSTFGNPDLSITSIDNYDLRYEIFPKPGEVIAISAFYKQFRDPIVTTFRLAGEQQFTWTNSEQANLYGLELEYRQTLALISEKLKNLTFSSNLSYIQSSQSIDEEEVSRARAVDPEFSDERVFNGQSDFLVNANLGYNNSETGWDAIIAFNYFSDRLRSIGAVGSPDIFERGRATLDVSLSKNIGNLRVSLRGKNLLNPQIETFSEFAGQDYLFTSYQRGQEISLGLSYGI